MVCRICNHTHAGGCRSCKKCHPNDALVPLRAQQRAVNNPNRNKNPNRVSSGIGPAVRPQPVVKTTWTVRGPNVPPRIPKGYVAHNHREVTTTEAVKYLSIDFTTTLPQLMGQNLTLLTVIVRMNSMSSNGWIGMVEDYKVNQPDGPNALSRKGFLKDQPRGWQFEPPSDLDFDTFARTHRVVIEFKTEVPAGAKVLVRDLYVVVSDLPRVQIPTDVLLVDEDLLEI
uniref:Coat protein n=1 Tax=Prunus necrotic ringspot virus TaxID=37733 RepID=A0A2S1B6I6_9BROM|nr:coat protein [Prunus necrotic ringspot virus]